MAELPLLSVVVPMRGTYDEVWYENLLSFRGSVEILLVFLPDEPPRSFEDPRVRALVSPFRGEFIQRLAGLLNASGSYVVTIDDDDFLHPGTALAAEAYFARFPGSWVLRLADENLMLGDTERLTRSWGPLPDLASAETCTAADLESGGRGEDPGGILLELPIAPLGRRFRLRHALWSPSQRADARGVHSENFVNRVWRADLLRPVLVDLASTLTLVGALKVVPMWTIDRLLGLYVQAYYYEPGIRIGHWLRGASLVRRVHRPPALRASRSYFVADSLLAKRFPRFGYFWNLFFHRLHREVAAAFRK
jgi:glycosyltransferase involved in cell wall biosynthesis